MLVRRGKEGLNGLKFGTFIGRFQSDGAASTAVKGLIGNTQISTLLLCVLYLSVELMITMNEYNFVSTKGLISSLR